MCPNSTKGPLEAEGTLKSPQVILKSHPDSNDDVEIDHISEISDESIWDEFSQTQETMNNVSPKTKMTSVS